MKKGSSSKKSEDLPYQPLVTETGGDGQLMHRDETCPHTPWMISVVDWFQERTVNTRSLDE